MGVQCQLLLATDAKCAAHGRRAADEQANLAEQRNRVVRRDSHRRTADRSVKITSVDAIPLGIPFKKPIRMAGRDTLHSETVLVRLETTGRFAGHGEAPVAPFLTGETVPSVLAAIAHVSNAIVGRDARDIVALGETIHNAIVGNAAAKAAVDIALHDAVARDYGIPVYRLLGGRTQDEFACLTLIGNSNKARDLSDAAARRAEGFTAFKLKVANGDLDEEAVTLIEMRSVLGARALVCADANAGWTAAEAIRFVKLVEIGLRRTFSSNRSCLTMLKAWLAWRERALFRSVPINRSMMSQTSAGCLPMAPPPAEHSRS